MWINIILQRYITEIINSNIDKNDEPKLILYKFSLSEFIVTKMNTQSHREYAQQLDQR